MKSIDSAHQLLTARWNFKERTFLSLLLSKKIFIPFEEVLFLSLKRSSTPGEKVLLWTVVSLSKAEFIFKDFLERKFAVDSRTRSEHRVSFPCVLPFSHFFMEYSLTLTRFQPTVSAAGGERESAGSWKLSWRVNDAPSSFTFSLLTLLVRTKSMRTVSYTVIFDSFICFFCLLPRKRW